VAGGHLVKDDTEGEDVGARVQVFAPRLFRGHVGHRAHRRAGTGQGILHVLRLGVRAGDGRAVFQQLGETEVEDLGVAARGDEDVGRLDVAVDDTAGVRGVQRIGDLDGQVDQATGRLRRMSSAL
jgi:hypothetical protein